MSTSPITTAPFLSTREAETDFRKSLTSMPLGQLQPLIGGLVEITKKENFDLTRTAAAELLKKAESISRVFFSVVKEKGLIEELEKDSHWKPWRENVDWIRNQIDSIGQGEEGPFRAVFPIVWH